MRTLTKKTTVNLFHTSILEDIKKTELITGSIDWPNRQFAWAVFIDGLQKDGQLTQKQAETWNNPPCVVAPWNR